jgi:hypothetical protein
MSNPGDLRVRIERILSSQTNPEKAAIQICVMLADEIDLVGNGWLDDDEFMLELLEPNDEEEDE